MFSSAAAGFIQRSAKIKPRRRMMKIRKIRAPFCVSRFSLARGSEEGSRPLINRTRAFSNSLHTTRWFSRSEEGRNKVASIFFAGNSRLRRTHNRRDAEKPSKRVKHNSTKSWRVRATSRLSSFIPIIRRFLGCIIYAT